MPDPAPWHDAPTCSACRTGPLVSPDGSGAHPAAAVHLDRLRCAACGAWRSLDLTSVTDVRVLLHAWRSMGAYAGRERAVEDSAESHRVAEHRAAAGLHIAAGAIGVTLPTAGETWVEFGERIRDAAEAIRAEASDLAAQVEGLTAERDAYRLGQARQAAEAERLRAVAGEAIDIGTQWIPLGPAQETGPVKQLAALRASLAPDPSRPARITELVDALIEAAAANVGAGLEWAENPDAERVDLKARLTAARSAVLGAAGGEL